MLALLIASPHKLLRESLAATLGSAPEYTPLAVVAQPEEALAACRGSRPETLVADAAFPRDQLLALITRLRELGLPVRIVIVGPADEAGVVPEAMAAGADAYADDEAGLAELHRTLQGLPRRHDCWPPWGQCLPFWRSAELGMRSATPFAAKPSLTVREAEILMLIAGGLANKQIAARLHLSLATVKNHVHNILAKLGVASRWAAAATLGPRWLETSVVSLALRQRHSA